MNLIQCVYGIEINGKWYIGATKDYDRRIRAHRTTLMKGTHYNGLLQEAFDEYHEFNSKIIKTIKLKESLPRYEIYYMGMYDSVDGGYNVHMSGARSIPILTEEYETVLQRVILALSEVKSFGEKLSALSVQDET